MNNPKVSVVIPVYNTEAYLEETVRSISGQTLREVEIIVIDDGSTDGSRAVAERLAADDGRITIHTQPNGGLSVARNAGLDRARGEFILFMDSDDVLEADALERCYERCKRDVLDFVFFNAVSFGAPAADAAWFDYRRAGPFKEEVGRGADILRRMLDTGCYRASACLSFIRTARLRALGLRFYPGILHEDELFTPQLYLGSERVGAIDRTFFHRRVREGSIMGRGFSQRNLESYLVVLRELHRFAAGRDTEARAAVGSITRLILSGTMRNAWSLPAAARWRLAFTALYRYPVQVRPRLLATLLLKKPLKRDR